MNITEVGVPVPDVIEAFKQAIKTASVSATDQGRDLRVGSVGLILHAIAVRSSGGGLNFHIPFIGMEVQLGAKLTTRNTHEIKINLTPPAKKTGRRYATAALTTSWSKPSRRSAPRWSARRTVTTRSF